MDTATAELRQRGLIQGIINEDALASASGPVYAGFDATARRLDKTAEVGAGSVLSFGKRMFRLKAAS